MADDLRFDQISYGPVPWAALPVLALALLVFAASRLRREGRPLSWAWALPQALLLLATTIWYLLGLGASDLPTLVISSLLMAAGGTLALARDRVCDLLPTWACDAIPLVASVVAGVCALELMWNERWWLANPTYLLLEGVLVAGLVLFSWLVSGRRGIGPAIVLAALGVIGLIQHFVVTFRGTSLLPSDILAAGTAMSVSGGYTYGLSNGMLRGFAALAVGLGATTLLRPSSTAHRIRDLALGACSLAVVVLLVCVPNYADAFGMTLDYWASRDSYAQQGFLPSFVYALQDMAVRAPEGHSSEAAKEATQELSSRWRTAETANRRAVVEQQFRYNRPNLIVIQNETFCDLSNFDGLHNGYEGPEFWNHGLDDALMRGSFAVSVFGGGTCNTEFESLTGNSLAFLGPGKYPFSMYDLSQADSIPRQLSATGYRTIGMHPNLASNWNRNNVYKALGFDEFLAIDDFAGAEEYHTHVSDWATYEKSLDLIAANDKPVFIFDVTMQNHSGYNTNSIPTKQLRGYKIPEVEDYVVPEVNEYLACIDESDRALQRLVERLRAMDEPTVVVMFGDHHPWMSEQLNDGLFPGEDPRVHSERIHQTSYVAWANYDVADWRATHPQPQDDTSADLLGAMVLDAIGAPLTGFQEAQLGARRDIRAINADGILNATGTWLPLKNPVGCEDTFRLLQLVEYDHFGTHL